MYVYQVFSSVVFMHGVVGRPPGFMYGGIPVQRGLGPQLPGWRPPFRAVPPPVRLMSAAAPALRPGADTVHVQHPTVTEQATSQQPRVQFVPMQVTVPSVWLLVKLILAVYAQPAYLSLRLSLHKFVSFYVLTSTKLCHCHFCCNC